MSAIERCPLFLSAIKRFFYEALNMIPSFLRKSVRYREVPLYLHRDLKTKDSLCHLGNEWRHTFQTFHTFHREPKLCLNSWFPSTITKDFSGKVSSSLVSSMTNTSMLLETNSFKEENLFRIELMLNWHE